MRKSEIRGRPFRARSVARRSSSSFSLHDEEVTGGGGMRAGWGSFLCDSSFSSRNEDEEGIRGRFPRGRGDEDEDEDEELLRPS